jgi:hypothetical protein
MVESVSDAEIASIATRSRPDTSGIDCPIVRV